MKTLLLMATITAIWIHGLSQASSAAITARPAAPRATIELATPATEVSALPRKIVKSIRTPTPTAPPSPRPSLIPVATEPEPDAWTLKVEAMNRRLSNDLDRYLYEDLKLSVHSLFEIRQAKQEFDDAMERAALIAHARDDYRQYGELRQRLTRERDERIEHAMGRDRYDAYRAFQEKQRQERIHDLYD